GKKLRRLVGVERAGRLRLRRPVVAQHGRDVREDDETPRAERADSQRGAVALVDHAVDSAQTPVARRDWDSAAATGDRARSGGEQRLDRAELEDLERGGGGNDAPVAAAGVRLESPAAVALELLSLLRRIER